MQPVNGQKLCPYAKVPFGWRTMGHNGCVILAIYNALLMTGRRAEVLKIRNFLHRIWKPRFFGVRAREAMRFLRRNRIPFRKASTVGELTSAMKPGSVAILFCWNRTVPFCHFTVGEELLSVLRFVDPFGGAHGMAATVTEKGKWRVFNRYSNRGVVYEYGDFREFCPFEALFMKALILEPAETEEGILSDPKL